MSFQDALIAGSFGWIIVHTTLWGVFAFAFVITASKVLFSVIDNLEKRSKAGGGSKV